MNKATLWKVTVRDFGWDRARTLYFRNKTTAETACDVYPAADKVQHIRVSVDKVNADGGYYTED